MCSDEGEGDGACGAEAEGKGRGSCGDSRVRGGSGRSRLWRGARCAPRLSRRSRRQRRAGGVQRACACWRGLGRSAIADIDLADIGVSLVAKW